MQAIVLAAGEGTRMRPLTSARPKVMLPVGGRPLLERIVLRAQAAGVDDFIFVIGYQADIVRSYFGDGSELGVSIEYAVQEEQLGTGHALLAARELADDRFLVLNGDVLPDAGSIRGMVEFDEALAVAAIEVPDPGRYGVFEVEDGFLKSVVEKSESPPSNLANAGIYLLDSEIFDALPDVVSERGEFELTDGLNELVSRGRVIQVVELEEWTEIGVPWDLLSANEVLLPQEPHRILGEVEAHVTLTGKVTVGKDTIIRSGTYIIGPVVIGESCDIGPNCFIRPYSCIGDNVRIGNGVEVKNSTVMENTNIGHLSYVGDSVIGGGCNFGAGTIIANLRHDNASVRSYVKGERMDSGRRKLGVIMGEDVKMGINTSVYPGTVIESGYRGRPGEVLWGYVAGFKEHAQ